MTILTAHDWRATAMGRCEVCDLIPREHDKLCAKAATDEAVARVEEHADPEWKVRALDAINTCALSFPHFTTDAVWALLDGGPETHERRALGAVMRDAARRGWIESTERTEQAARVVAHQRPQRVWHSLIYGGPS